MLNSRGLWQMFVGILVTPRKKNRFIPEKSQKRSWSNPHQGHREKARRVRQMASGMIFNYRKPA